MSRITKQVEIQKRGRVPRASDGNEFICRTGRKPGVHVCKVTSEMRMRPCACPSRNLKGLEYFFSVTERGPQIKKHMDDVIDFIESCDNVNNNKKEWMKGVKTAARI